MNWPSFRQSYGAMARERSGSRFIISGLVVLCLVLSFGLITKKPVVILVPPDLSQESEIAANNASAPVKKAWGLVVANLVGNVTPGNVEFVQRSLEGLLAPTLYNDLLKSLQDQALTIQEGQMSLSFVPESVTYQKSHNLVFVSGQSTKRGPFSEPVQEKRTYEFEIVVKNYRPYVLTWEAYAGNPRVKRNATPEEKRDPVQISMEVSDQ